MAVIEGMRSDSPHGYRYTPINRFYHQEQNIAVQEMSDKVVQAEILEWFGSVADTYWKAFKTGMSEGMSDGDAYRYAADIAKLVLTADEMSDPDFHEVLHLRKPA